MIRELQEADDVARQLYPPGTRRPPRMGRHARAEDRLRIAALAVSGARRVVDPKGWAADRSREWYQQLAPDSEARKKKRERERARWPKSRKRKERAPSLRGWTRPETVAAIRAARATGMKQAVIATRFGVSQTTVSNILRGASRAGVP